MSELKAYIVYTPREGVVEGLWKSYAIRIDGAEVYLKSDADKVIAELKEQIGVLEHQACKMNCMTVKLYNEACDDLIYQKYKRCLAKKDECKLRSARYQDLWEKWRKTETDTSGSYYKDYIKWWHRAMKWRNLAEEYK